MSTRTATVTRHLAAALLLALCCVARPVQADTNAPDTQHQPQHLVLSGPRVGVSFLQGKSYASLKEHVGRDAYPFVTIVGWQFEHAWLEGKNGTAGLIEIVPTISGFNQGLVVPGINLLIGLRSASGLEAGMGGQLSVVGGRDVFAGGALFAVGATVRGDALNLPIHLVWVTSAGSQRVGIVFGFSAAAP